MMFFYAEGSATDGVKLGSVGSQLNHLSLPRVVTNQKWHCFINGLCCPTSPKRQRGYIETKVTSQGTALHGAALICLKKVMREMTHSRGHSHYISVTDRIWWLQSHPSESMRAGQRKENRKSVPPPDQCRLVRLYQQQAGTKGRTLCLRQYLVWSCKILFPVPAPSPSSHFENQHVWKSIPISWFQTR